LGFVHRASLGSLGELVPHARVDGDAVRECDRCWHASRRATSRRGGEILAEDVARRREGCCEHIEAFRHDDVPAAFALLDTGVIVHTTHISGSFGAVSRGHEGVVREVRRFMGAFDDYAFEVERMSDLAARLWLW
jgi:hypothetical protein